MEEHPRHPTFENTFRDQRGERPMSKQSSPYLPVCRGECGIRSVVPHVHEHGKVRVVFKSEHARQTPAPPAIGPYVIFETKFERGCVAATHPDSDGDFDGFDSAGEAICFNVAEVVKVGRDCFR